MTKIMFSVFAAGLVLAWGSSGWAAEKQNPANQNAFEEKANAVNARAKKQDMFNVAIHAVSVETGVPENQLREMHKKHPGAGPAGILVASVMADETKKPPEKFLETHSKGKTWEAIARDNHVPLTKVNDRLDHLERALGNAKAEPPARK